MDIIENYKAIHRHANKIMECVELAITIHSAPANKRTPGDLADVLGIIQRMTDHLIIQMEKGISMEEELKRIAEAAKDMPGAKIYVGPWGTIFEQTAPY